MSYQHTRKGQSLLYEIRDLEKCVGIFPGEEIELEEEPMEDYLQQLKHTVGNLSNSKIRNNQLIIEIKRRDRLCKNR